LGGPDVDAVGQLQRTATQATISVDAGWQAPYSTQLDPVTAVPAKVRALAGAGRSPPLPPSATR